MNGPASARERAGELPKGVDPEAEEAFRRFYTEVNLRRVRWILVLSFLVCSTYSLLAIFQPRLFAMLSPTATPGGYFFLTAASGAMWGLVEWAQGEASSATIQRRVMAVYYVTGSLLNIPLFWQIRTGILYLISLIAFGTVLILPPRVAFPLLGGTHVLFVVAMFLAYRNPTKALQETLLLTMFLAIAGYISFVLHKARREGFFKERTIVRQVKELEAANAEMNDLMAITAHNLGSPLQGLSNILELVRLRAGQGLDREHLVMALGAASQSCEAMIALVRRLLDAHAAEHAGETAEPAEIDLVPEFLAAAKRAGPLADAKGMRLALDLPLVRPLVGQAQPALLGEVLDNLLSNAVKYAPGGTTVTLALFQEDGACRGEVRDEGPGIAESECPQLFCKFSNGQNKPTGGEESTGLGLFIVRKLMEGMGGKAGYRPGTPRGAVFWVEVPGAAGP